MLRPCGMCRWSALKTVNGPMSPLSFFLLPGTMNPCTGPPNIAAHPSSVPPVVPWYVPMPPPQDCGGAASAASGGASSWMADCRYPGQARLRSPPAAPEPRRLTEATGPPAAPEALFSFLLFPGSSPKFSRPDDFCWTLQRKTQGFWPGHRARSLRFGRACLFAGSPEPNASAGCGP